MISCGANQMMHARASFLLKIIFLKKLLRRCFCSYYFISLFESYYSNNDVNIYYVAVLNQISLHHILSGRTHKALEIK